jgi:hypothetical protein
MDESRAPWWAQPRARLAVLVAVLAGVSAYGVPRIVAEGFGRAAAVPVCPPLVPPTVRVDRPDMQGLWPLAKGGGDVSRDRDDTGDAWTDQRTVPLRRAAGYMLVWWRRHEVLSASVFAFRSAADAAAYVAAAGSTRCRGPARAFGISRPAGGRVVVWTNPVLNLQADVFFARGDRVYRITEVPADAWNKVPRAVDVGRYALMTERVACELPEAGCG